GQSCRWGGTGGRSGTRPAPARVPHPAPAPAPGDRATLGWWAYPAPALGATSTPGRVTHLRPHPRRVTG
ncbi:hypothetical protein ACFUVR_35075, partial [Streptomyces sp. NPDC057375]